jgi:hypothetical protein
MVADLDAPLRFLPLPELTQLHTNKLKFGCTVPNQTDAKHTDAKQTDTKHTTKHAVKYAANHMGIQNGHSHNSQSHNVHSHNSHLHNVHSQNEFSQLLVNKTSNSYHVNISFYQLSLLEGALHCATTPHYHCHCHYSHLHYHCHYSHLHYHCHYSHLLSRLEAAHSRTPVEASLGIRIFADASPDASPQSGQHLTLLPPWSAAGQKVSGLQVQ